MNQVVGSANTMSPVKGKDIIGELNITFEEGVFGAEKKVLLPLCDICPVCNGGGRIQRQSCGNCAGTGYVKSKKTIQVKVPAGIDNGQSIRLRQMGDLGSNGGERGDLLVKIHMEPHPFFFRRGYDLYSIEYFPADMMRKGKKITVATIDGDYTFKLPSDIENGKRIKLKGKGIPTLKNKQIRGDHYVEIIYK